MEQRHGSSFHSGVGRRQFLQQAVMGVLAVPLASSSLNSSAPAAQTQAPAIEIASGTLAGVTPASIDIAVNGNLRHILLQPNASIWRGGDTVVTNLQKGDDIMVKITNPSGAAVRVWSNLSRVRGIVVARSKSGYDLQVGGQGTPQQNLLLEISQQAIFGDAMTYVIGSKIPSLAVGDAVDAIGERISGGIRATLMYSASSKTSNPSADTMPQAVGAATVRRVQAGPNTMCNYSYNGYASWFDCPSGAGRCGTCNTSNGLQLAWPALDTCGCCSPTCCDCSKNCMNQVYLSCGSTVNVLDACSSNRLACSVVSCGPCQEANCSGCSPQRCNASCGDCAGHTTNVVDLTKPTFAYFYDPTIRGCFSCSVNTTVVC